jgi:hypothetical protein
MFDGHSPSDLEAEMNADAIIKILFGLLMAILGWMGIDTLKRIRHLEGDTLRKSDLTALQAQLAQEHQDNKGALADNSERLSGVEDTVSGVHRRIDELYRALVK